MNLETGRRAARTEVETPYVLEALAPIATSDDDHYVLHQIGGVIAAWGWPFAPRNRQLLPLHLVERAGGLESPDVVQRLQPVPTAEHPDLVLV